MRLALSSLQRSSGDLDEIQGWRCLKRGDIISAIICIQLGVLFLGHISPRALTYRLSSGAVLPSRLMPVNRQFLYDLRREKFCNLR
jgi:hypothetical protein